MTLNTETWVIFVCGCPGKTHEEDWATADLGDGPVAVTCGSCRKEIREVEVRDLAPDDH
jgi:hypothetical protein